MLCAPTPGLATYLDECQNGQSSWDGFRDHSASASYRELVETLADLQRGLCGYCEIDLKESDRQVEHVIPRNDPARGCAEALNAGNLIACCRGGAARSLHGPDAAADEERYREPAKRNLSCGQAKGDKSEAAFADPRLLPALPSVTKVYPSGRIEADVNACARCEIDPSSVSRTIEILRLNVERLRLPRARRWRALNRNWSQYFDDPEVMESAARSELLPDQDGDLHRFFTTSRSYFGPYGERCLEQDAQRWV